MLIVMSQDAIEIKFIFLFLVMCNIGIFRGVKYEKKKRVNEGLKILTFGSYNKKTFLSSAGRLVSTLNSI